MRGSRALTTAEIINGSSKSKGKYIDKVLLYPYLPIDKVLLCPYLPIEVELPFMISAVVNAQASEINLNSFFDLKMYISVLVEKDLAKSTVYLCIPHSIT